MQYLRAWKSSYIVISVEYDKIARHGNYKRPEKYLFCLTLFYFDTSHFLELSQNFYPRQFYGPTPPTPKFRPTPPTQFFWPTPKFYGPTPPKPFFWPTSRFYRPTPPTLRFGPCRPRAHASAPTVLFGGLCGTRGHSIGIENNEFEKVRIKNRTCYYFDDIIKLEDFDFDNSLNSFGNSRTPCLLIIIPLRFTCGERKIC